MTMNSPLGKKRRVFRENPNAYGSNRAAICILISQLRLNSPSLKVSSSPPGHHPALPDDPCSCCERRFRESSQRRCGGAFSESPQERQLPSPSCPYSPLSSFPRHLFLQSSSTRTLHAYHPPSHYLHPLLLAAPIPGEALANRACKPHSFSASAATHSGFLHISLSQAPRREKISSNTDARRRRACR
jgi:hypothetical protein